ncbi:unnamed protein product [Rotaria sp. Silwood1]|nr:unnamed protein product [Rotaria sp. Silwood1]
MIDRCSSGAYVILPVDQQQATVYVALSFISIEQARTNLQMQTQLKSFDSIHKFVSAEWNHEAVIKFNAAIVHLLSSPTKCDESNGVYLGFDDQIYTKPDNMKHICTDLSIWDAHRTQISFILFHDSQRANDIIRSIMLIVEQGGDIPK